MAYKIISALELAKENTWGVDLPSYSARKRIPVGSHAQLVFEEPGRISEGVWIKVTSRTTARYHGVVKYRPYRLKQLKMGMVIEFLPKHVTYIDHTMR